MQSNHDNPGKLMSISSIISKPYNHEPIHHKVPAMKRNSMYPLFRSPPASEPSSPNSFSSVQFNSFYKRHSEEEDFEEEHSPLTMEERRQRNKTASAKYRKKKLSEHHAVLERQLQELRQENERLKSTSDKLRGKMEARKMLKKWMDKQSDRLDGYHYNSMLDLSHSDFEDSL
ncbi:hypothetical protein BY458DRAFT_521676 [Sporodiniella umbellata]|nr:hypothetical protein BY458DRAFT_521676 [Sporodiniella umbellata]